MPNGTLQEMFKILHDMETREDGVSFIYMYRFNHSLSQVITWARFNPNFC